MINQIKHNSPGSALSQFNPVASLKPKTRSLVNELFITPIIKSFFFDKGGIDNYSELDPDKLKTEVEFNSTDETQSFVKTYIYKEIVNSIAKVGKIVEFKPRYIITFDSDLTNYKRDSTLYPYTSIFNDNNLENTNIKYGVIRLGNAPILFYILVDLQKIIQFIKTLPLETDIQVAAKIFESDEEKRSRLIEKVIFDKQRLMKNADSSTRIEIQSEIDRLEQVGQTVLEGQSGNLRINLAWNTTDDLDLHVLTPSGEISYLNKTVEYMGVIGRLDVDKNTGSNIVSNPQENINFDSIPLGHHKIFVEFYSQREKIEVPFTLTIIQANGEGRIFNSVVSGKGNRKDVVSFDFKNNTLEFTEIS
jgi:hypothetical protein